VTPVTPAGAPAGSGGGLSFQLGNLGGAVINDALMGGNGLFARPRL
jgi:hypothetical protein